MAATENATSAIPTTKSGVTEIEAAATAHTWEFAAYVAFGVIAAIVLAFLTWRVWKSGNRLQDAIKHDAEVRIEEAKRDAALGLAAANTEIARLNAETERLNIERLKLEAIVAGRQLAPEQIKAVAQSLRRFAGRKLFITSYTGDAEAARLGLQIKVALENAGIHVDDNLGRTFAERGGVGFGVVISGPPNEKDLTDAIAESLKVHGKIGAESHSIFPKMRIEDAVTGIMVSLRPLDRSK